MGNDCCKPEMAEKSINNRRLIIEPVYYDDSEMQQQVDTLLKADFIVN